MAKRVFSVAGANMNKRGTYSDIFIELSDTPAYRNGDITVWRIRKGSYIYCYKNIAVMELMGMNKELLEEIQKPDKVFNDYIPFITKQRIKNAEKYAKEYGFKLESI